VEEKKGDEKTQTQEAKNNRQNMLKSRH